MSDGKFVDVFDHPEEKRGQGPEPLNTEKVGLGLYRFELERSHRGSSADYASETVNDIAQSDEVDQSYNFTNLCILCFLTGLIVGFMLGALLTLLIII